MRGRTLATFFATTALIVALASPRAAFGGKTVYLSLGDSIAFGETNFTANPSNGDRGYVSLYADSLMARNGGVRPTVINLAIDGETTASFASGTGRVTPNPGFTETLLIAQNTNYTDNPSANQHDRLLSTVAQQLEQGNTIGSVTVSLGSNDLFALAQSPGFLSLPPEQQGVMLAQTLGAIQANYATILADVKSLAPGADVRLVGSYNPFPGAPGSPFASLAGPAIEGLNAVIAGQAMAFGAKYIDTATVFQGNESAFTYIADGTFNVHPNGLGYAAIGLALHAVPEPTTLALLGTMGLGLLISRRYRRNRAVIA